MSRCPAGRIPLVCCALFVLSLAIPSPASADEPPLQRVTEQGPVHVTVTLAPTEPLIGDAVELTVEVVAEPQVEVLMPEFGEALERYRILEFVPRQTIDDAGRTHSTQIYSLQPPMSGQHSIPPLLIEFVDRRPDHEPAPAGEDSYELLTERLDFTVQSVVPAGAKTDLEPPLGELEPLAPPPAARWPWVVGGIAVVLVAAPFLVRAAIAVRRRARRRSAYDVAKARLERLLARPSPAPGEVDRFYVELSSIARRYLEDRFELRAPELTTEEFLEIVSDSPDLDLDHQRRLRDFLGAADLVKFAHHIPEESAIRESVETVRRFLDETRENAPMLDVEEQEEEVQSRA